MRILGLYQHPKHVCFRYRLQAFRPYLERAGHEVRFRGWPRWWLFDSDFVHDVRQADLVVVQRRLLAGWQLRRLRRAARALAFDFDDAIFLRDSFDPRGLDCERRRLGFARMMEHADLVLAGNSYLREQALEWTTPERVKLVPTCVNVGAYSCADHRSQATTQLVWIGSSSTLRGLERVAGLLNGLGQTMDGLELKVICDRPLNLPGLACRFCPWSQGTEAHDLATSAIGISWLPPDDWSLGKCGLKVLQYMAAGLPVVANPVGMQAQLVRHNETGFLAESALEWQAAIRQLQIDPGLRAQMGARGRALVEQNYHVTRGAAAWLDLLSTLRHDRVAVSPCT